MGRSQPRLQPPCRERPGSRLVPHPRRAKQHRDPIRLVPGGLRRRTGSHSLPGGCSVRQLHEPASGRSASVRGGSGGAVAGLLSPVGWRRVPAAAAVKASSPPSGLRSRRSRNCRTAVLQRGRWQCSLPDEPLQGCACPARALASGGVPDQARVWAFPRRRLAETLFRLVRSPCHRPAAHACPALLRSSRMASVPCRPGWLRE